VPVHARRSERQLAARLAWRIFYFADLKSLQLEK
jgi:hypothetical protein